MNKKEKLVVNEVYIKLDRIVNFDNKNLKQKQYFDMVECVDKLKSIMKDEK